MDEDGRILIKKCSCTCASFIGKDPCSHILALRLQHSIPKEERKVGDVSFEKREEVVSEEIQEIMRTLAEELKESKGKPKRRKPRKSTRTDSSTKSTQKKKTATKAKRKSKKTTSKKATVSLKVLKDTIDYSSLKNQVLDKGEVEDILSTLAEYEGSAAYSAILQLMLDELMCASSSRRLIKTHLASAEQSQVEDETENEDTPEEEDVPEEQEEIDLSSVKVIFVGRFSGFTKKKLNRAAKKAGAAVASSIAKANVVVKGTHIGSSQKKQLKSFDGETIDIDTWTECISSDE